MAKLYYTDEIGEIMDKKLDRKAREIVMDTNLQGEDLLKAVEEFRALKKGLYSFMDVLKEEDEAYDAKMAAYKAAREEKDGENS